MLEHPKSPPTVTLCAALILLSVVPSVAWAGPAASEPAPVVLLCDTNLLEPEDGERLQRRLFAALEPVLEGEGMRPCGPTEPASQILRIHLITFDPQRRAYGLRVELSAASELRISSFGCADCSEAQLVEELGQAVARLLAPTEVGEQIPTPSLAVGSRPRRLGSLGIGGAVLLGVGVGACVSGTALMVHGIERSSDLRRATIVSTDFRPAGAITLVAGAVATTVGATLLAFDLSRRHDRRGLALQVTPTYFGIELTRKF